jgi:cell division septation protein DedD
VRTEETKLAGVQRMAAAPAGVRPRNCDAARRGQTIVAAVLLLQFALCCQRGAAFDVSSVALDGMRITDGVVATFTTSSAVRTRAIVYACDGYGGAAVEVARGVDGVPTMQHALRMLLVHRDDFYAPSMLLRVIVEDAESDAMHWVGNVLAQLPNDSADGGVRGLVADNAAVRGLDVSGDAADAAPPLQPFVSRAREADSRAGAAAPRSVAATLPSTARSSDAAGSDAAGSAASAPSMHTAPSARDVDGDLSASLGALADVTRGDCACTCLQLSCCSSGDLTALLPLCDAAASSDSSGTVSAPSPSASVSVSAVLRTEAHMSSSSASLTSPRVMLASTGVAVGAAVAVAAGVLALRRCSRHRRGKGDASAVAGRDGRRQQRRHGGRAAPYALDDGGVVLALPRLQRGVSRSPLTGDRERRVRRASDDGTVDVPRRALLLSDVVDESSVAPSTPQRSRPLRKAANGKLSTRGRARARAVPPPSLPPQHENRRASVSVGRASETSRSAEAPFLSRGEDPDADANGDGDGGGVVGPGAAFVTRAQSHRSRRRSSVDADTAMRRRVASTDTTRRGRSFSSVPSGRASRDGYSDVGDDAGSAGRRHGGEARHSDAGDGASAAATRRRVRWQTPLRDVVRFHRSQPANRVMAQ